MPIYEYQCRECDEEFELLVKGSVTPKCPKCGGTKLEKKFSSFAPAGGNKTSGSGGGHQHHPGCGCGSPMGTCGLG